MFRRGRKEASPLRQFVYVSDLKLRGLLEQIPTPVRRDIAAELKIDLKVVSLDLKTSTANRSPILSQQFARLALVEENLKRHRQIGDLSSKNGYFKAEAPMDWMPLADEETVLFCGYVDDLLLILGGSVSHLLGQPPAAMLVGSQPYTIRAAIHGTGTPRAADLSRDLLAVTRVIYVTPQPVKFLASVIARGTLPQNRLATHYLLATPLYVELDHKVDK